MKLCMYSMAILFVVLATGCVDVKEGDLKEGFGSIEGTVKNLDGSAVPDALIYIQTNLSLFTKAINDGSFLLQEVPAGIHTVMAYSEEGIGASAQATVFADETTTVELVLASTGKLTGTVTLEGEQDHAGTLVYLVGTASAAYTDGDGMFQVDLVVPGCYSLRAEHAGFYPKELDSVCIQMDQVKNLQEITLLRRGVPDCMDDDDCAEHQVCENRICSFEAGFSAEACDGADNDGDGYTDEGVAEPCGTTEGACELGISLCLGGAMADCKGGVLSEDEICDGTDNDCDGLTDEDFDVDGDTFTTCAGDCDDTDPAVYPSATEICDGIDNDCDTELDEGCPVECLDANLDVTAVDAPSRQPLAGAHVTVVDADGVAHTADTDAGGVASFTGLAGGARRSITVVSDDTVPPLPGVGGPDRPRYETTTLLDQCTYAITVPLRLTRSGQAARPTGTVAAKVPASLFAMLPHSWKCAGDCMTDNDCDETYYCETTTAPCVDKCTPRSLLPFFALGDANISGQMRVAMLVPVFAEANFTYRDLNRIFAPPPRSEAVWSGNHATDDTFLNGLSSALGLDPWGDACVRTSDCQNPVDFVCEQDPQGDYRCKDRNPMRNVETLVPAGTNVKLTVVLGIVDIDMLELLPVLLPFLTGIGEYGFDTGAMLAAHKMHTLHVCPIVVNVTAGVSNDITFALAGIRREDCWSVDYQQQEVIDPVRDENSIKPSNECGTDNDCGWPDSGKTCRPDPENPVKKYCFTPMFRVHLLSGDTINVLPDETGFDPTEVNADARLCSWLPDTAEFELMCLRGDPDIYVPCDPPEYYDLPVPPGTECSFPYGVALAALDIPQGHARLPEGGRVFIGYNFNRSPQHNHPEPDFLVPFEVMDGNIGLSVTQMYFRSLRGTGDGSFGEMPGWLTAQASSKSIVDTLQLPPMFAVPALDPPPPDAGLSVDIIFEAEDPTAYPPALTRAYAVATGMQSPTAGVHDLIYDLTETTLSGEDMKGVVLSRVDYDAAVTHVDPWWRIYAPAGMTSISLPMDASPFASGENVWVTPYGCDMDLPFRYDLFPTDAILGPLRKYSEDSYAVIVP